jgi:hypothetical protein
MGTAHVAAALGMFALWMWGHYFFLLNNYCTSGGFPRCVFSNQAGRL